MHCPAGELCGVCDGDAGFMSASTPPQQPEGSIQLPFNGAAHHSGAGRTQYIHYVASRMSLQNVHSMGYKLNTLYVYIVSGVIL